MALSDLILKAKVNMALVRDPRVSAFDINVNVTDGVVILTGDLDREESCSAAEEIVRSVEGVTSVRNEMTCGLRQTVASATELIQHFLQKLDAAWDDLPDQTALSQADYLRWALWMITKFHIPESFDGDRAQLEAAATESALEQISGYIQIPKVLLALEMLRQAEVLMPPHPNAPKPETATLVSTPIVNGSGEAPALGIRASRDLASKI